MKDKKDKSLYYLDELSDYKVKSDDPDVRGWELVDKDRRRVGKVDNLLVNKKTEKVVYLDVEVDSSIIEANHKPYSGSASKGVHEYLNKDGENHVIIPIGLVRLDGDNKTVMTNEITHQTFAETKRKERGELVERDYEIVVLESYNRDDNANYPEDDTLYDRKEYDTTNFRTS
jgi:sporulation protein YlmC with PRC-barrel domain